MKIAYLPGAFFPDPGGAQVQVHNLANIMHENGNNVEVLTLKKTNIINSKYKIFILNTFLINLVFIFHYYIKINLSFILEFYLKSLIRKKNYDVWHFIFLNYKSLLIINSLHKLNQKIIVTFQGADIQINRKISYGNRLDKNYNNLLKMSLQKISSFTSISKNIYQDLIQLKVPKKKIYQIPNGIPLRKFKLSNKYIHKKKRGTIKLITVARYAEKKKGYDLVPSILKNLKKLNIKFKWVIIGKNTSQLYKNSYIKKNKNYFKILENLFIGKEKYFPSKKIIKEYIEADLYVNLSRIESFGITFVESLGANTPVITYNTKGANEIIKNNYNGFVIKENNQSAFCQKIKKIYKEKNFFKKKPFQSSKKYDFNNLIKKYFYIYQQDL